MRAPLFLALLLLAVTSCRFFDDGDTKSEDDQLLARVYDKELHLSDMEGMFPQRGNREDSVAIIRSFVRAWTQDAVLQHQSETNLPTNVNVDKLVRDYRASLVRSLYEKELVATIVDSTITRQQLEAYYEENKSQYQLEKPIIQCYFLKVPYPTPEADLLNDLWNDGRPQDSVALRGYCDKYAEIKLLDPMAWYSLEEIAGHFPEGTLTAGNARSKQEFIQQYGQNRYYFRLIQFKNTLEIAPLSYVENQARRVILHNRRKVGLEQVTKELFDDALRNNDIEIYYSGDTLAQQ